MPRWTFVSQPGSLSSPSLPSEAHGCSRPRRLLPSAPSHAVNHHRRLELQQLRQGRPLQPTRGRSHEVHLGPDTRMGGRPGPPYHRAGLPHPTPPGGCWPLRVSGSATRWIHRFAHNHRSHHRPRLFLSSSARPSSLSRARPPPSASTAATPPSAAFRSTHAKGHSFGLGRSVQKPHHQDARHYRDAPFRHPS